MNWLRTLRARFALWVAGLLLVVLAAFGAIMYASLGQGLSASLDSSLQVSAAQAIAAVNIENGQINFNDSLPSGSVTTSLRDRGLTIRVLSPAGQLIQAVGPYRLVPVQAASLAAARQGQPFFSTVNVPGESAPVRFYMAPIRENGQLLGSVEVAQSLASVQETLQRLAATLLVAGPLLVVVAALGGYFLAARALLPIDHITTTAKRIAEGGQDLSARLHLPETNDEVGRLAATFDDMLARLDESFRRERQFTADASHELRTPLTAMQAILNLMREGQRSTGDYEQALADISDETNRLHGLVENLLHLARSDSHLALDLEQIDLSTLLTDITDSLQPLAAAKALALNCQVPSELCLTGDRDSLIRLFVNLLDNAIKNTEHGSVTVQAGLRQHQVRVIVSDTGTGIAPEHLGHIFDRFYRVDRARNSRGTGLGLAIALSIARAHGGTIEVSSALDAGSAFTVLLATLASN